MRETARTALKDIASERDICGMDSRQLEALLKDLCPNCHREVFALVAAHRLGMANRIQQLREVTPIHIKQMSRTLSDRCGIANYVAIWTVDAWTNAVAARAAPQPRQPRRQKAVSPAYPQLTVSATAYIVAAAILLATLYAAFKMSGLFTSDLSSRVLLAGVSGLVLGWPLAVLIVGAVQNHRFARRLRDRQAKAVAAVVPDVLPGTAPEQPKVVTPAPPGPAEEVE